MRGARAAPASGPAPPRQSYFDDVRDQHRTVEDYVSAQAGNVAIAHSPAELDTLIGGGVPILVHAVEGGFQLGHDPAEVRRNVRELAGLGVAYVTLADLFFRGVATNATGAAVPCPTGSTTGCSPSRTEKV
jgi:hypothetical protein